MEIQKRRRRRRSPERQRASFGVGGTNDDVATPDELLEVLRDEFGVLFDPCPLRGRGKRGANGLECSWKTRGDKLVFVNPPYSETQRWLEKGVAELKQRGVQSVFLIPARLWRVYWFELIYPHATEVRIIKGGVRFKGFDAGAPMGSALVIFRRRRGSRQMRSRTTKAGDFEFQHFYF